MLFTENTMRYWALNVIVHVSMYHFNALASIYDMMA